MNDPRLAEIFDVSKIMDTTPTPDELISTREATHGDFDENARVWQGLCEMASHTEFTCDRQRLAINMIFLKIARLMQNPNVRDHWDDIAGYARLGADGCSK